MSFYGSMDSTTERLPLPSWIDNFETQSDRRAVVVDDIRSGNDGDVTISCVTEFLLKDKKNPVCIDIGCADGWWSQFVKNRYNASVTAFEPNERSFDILKKRWLNDDLIRVYPFAVSSQHGVLKFTDSGNDSHSRGEGTTQVPAVRLQSFLRGPVDLMKIDVEGHEPHILASLHQEIPMFESIVFELSPHWQDSPSIGAELLTFMGQQFPYIYHLSRRKTIEIYPMFNLQDLANSRKWIDLFLSHNHQTDILCSRTPVTLPNYLTDTS